jgi:hypothetical protein
MTSIPIVTRFWPRETRNTTVQPVWLRRLPLPQRPNPHQLAQSAPELPDFVRQSPVAMRYLRFLGALDWDRFPERDLERYRYRPPLPYAPFAAACLVKLEEAKPNMSKLRDYLVEHPALIWLLGFPLVSSNHFPWGFDPEASLPTHRHFTRMLRSMPNACLQFLLDETVRLLQIELSIIAKGFGLVISLDTKHILAWLTSVTAMTRPSNPKVIPTVAWDVRDDVINASLPRSPSQRLAIIPFLLAPSPLASITGATAQALWLPRSPIGANSSSLNSPNPSTAPMSPTFSP